MLDWKKKLIQALDEYERREDKPSFSLLMDRASNPNSSDDVVEFLRALADIIEGLPA